MGAQRVRDCEAGSGPESTHQRKPWLLGIFAAAVTLSFTLPGVVFSGSRYGMLHGLRGLPLALGHSHNDEAQAWPLQTALAEGAASPGPGGSYVVFWRELPKGDSELQRWHIVCALMGGIRSIQDPGRLL